MAPNHTLPRTHPGALAVLRLTSYWSEAEKGGRRGHPALIDRLPSARCARQTKLSSPCVASGPRGGRLLPQTAGRQAGKQAAQ